MAFIKKSAPISLRKRYIEDEIDNSSIAEQLQDTKEMQKFRTRPIGLSAVELLTGHFIPKVSNIMNGQLRNRLYFSP